MKNGPIMQKPALDHLSAGDGYFYVVFFSRQGEFLLLSPYPGLQNIEPEAPGLPLNGCDQSYS